MLSRLCATSIGAKALVGYQINSRPGTAAVFLFVVVDRIPIVGIHEVVWERVFSMIISGLTGNCIAD